MRRVSIIVIALLAVLVVLQVAAMAIPDRLTALGLSAERRFGGLTVRAAQVEGFTMPYLEGGQGEPLLLIHGFGGDKDNFTRIARHLTPHYRVLIPDLPGFGDSAPRKMDGSYRMADQVRRLHALLGQLGIKRIHLGGNSMGGFIAAQFAATHPDMVASVWLLDPSGTAVSHDTALLREYARTGENPLLARQVGDVDNMIASTMHQPPYFPGFVRDTLGRRAVADLALHRRILQQVHGSPLLEASYKSIAAPALIVWGDRDQILNPAGAASFQALFPRSQVVMMKEIGHLPMIEAPAQTAADYLRFRAGLSAR